jgi:hypothetical protein
VFELFPKKKEEEGEVPRILTADKSLLQVGLFCPGPAVADPFFFF